MWYLLLQFLLLQSHPPASHRWIHNPEAGRSCRTESGKLCFLGYCWCTTAVCQGSGLFSRRGQVPISPPKLTSLLAFSLAEVWRTKMKQAT